MEESLSSSSTSDLSASLDMFQPPKSSSTPKPSKESPETDDLDAYADELLMRCDFLLEIYEKEFRSPERLDVNVDVSDELKKSHQLHHLVQSTQTSELMGEALIDELTPSVELRLKEQVDEPVQPVYDSEEVRKVNRSDGLETGERFEDVLDQHTEMSSEDDSDSLDSEEAFLYLSPASSVSTPLHDRSRGSSQCRCDETAVRASHPGEVASLPTHESLSMDEVEPYLDDEIVKSLWKRLVEVRSKRMESQRR